MPLLDGLSDELYELGLGPCFRMPHWATMLPANVALFQIIGFGQLPEVTWTVECRVRQGGKACFLGGLIWRDVGAFAASPLARPTINELIPLRRVSSRAFQVEEDHYGLWYLSMSKGLSVSRRPPRALGIPLRRDRGLPGSLPSPRLCHALCNGSSSVSCLESISERLPRANICCFGSVDRN